MEFGDGVPGKRPRVAKGPRWAEVIPEDTAEAAEFIQAHKEDIDRYFGPPEKWEDGSEPTAILRLRLARSVLSRLKVQAARSGLTLANYAAADLRRLARTDRTARRRA
jgi:hypothetical protein